jgi:phage gp29-like protein
MKDAGILFLQRPAPLPSKPSFTEDATGYSFFDRWSNHPGNSLTPARIQRIYLAAEFGYPQEQCDLFEDVIEGNAHLRSVLEGRLRAVSGKEWSIQPASDDLADVDAALALEGGLRQTPNLRATLRHQLKKRWFGYSGSEILWERLNGYFTPVWFANVPHRRFIFDPINMTDYARLLTKNEPAYGMELEPGRWLFSREDGRVAAMSGLMRTATWWSMFKSRTIGHWMIYSERYGFPLPIGTYTEDTPQKERDNLIQALRKIGRDGFAAMLDKCKIESLRDAGGAGKADDVQGAITNLCNTEISKLVLGATLTNETQGPGSHALGQVHADAFFERLLDDEASLDEDFTRDVSVPFIHFNGLKGRPPRLKIHLVRENTPAARMKLFVDFVNGLGGKLDADQVRQELQIKPPSGEALTGPPTPPASGLKPSSSDGGAAANSAIE